MVTSTPLTDRQLRATIRQMLKDWNASTEVQRAIALDLSCTLMKAKEDAKPPKSPRSVDHPYTPERWTDDQRACHQAASMEEAFHQASCLSGGWYHRAVVIWCAVVGREEKYWILPEDASRPSDADYHRAYRVERCPDE